jgi:hypothetical protein
VLTISSLSTELTVIHEVALTVIGTPFTFAFIAIGPTVCWAVACDTRPTKRNTPKKNVLISRPHTHNKLELSFPKRQHKLDGEYCDIAHEFHQQTADLNTG